jgi:hypothetical protein
MTSRGVLFFAFNNEKINYAKIAAFASKQVKKYLKCDITVITNTPKEFNGNDYVDNVIVNNVNSNYTKLFHDGKDSVQKLTWMNTSRYTCYELSPYDETLVLDVDYFLNSDNLSYCWNSPHDFLIYKNSLDLSQLRQKNNNLTFISDYSIPFYWATVFYFKKTKITESFFNLINHIKENWTYYRLLYQLNSVHFRNDHAFSIAIHIFNGFTDKGFVNELPGKLYYSFDTDYVIKLEDNNIQLLVEAEQSYTPLKIKNLDVHLMNKFNILKLLESNV